MEQCDGVRHPITQERGEFVDLRSDHTLTLKLSEMPLDAILSAVEKKSIQQILIVPLMYCNRFQ